MANCPEKSLWEQVCEEFEAEQPSSPPGKWREIDPTAVEIHENPVTGYLERNVFPVLLQGLEALLREGQKYGWFEREKTACVPYVFLIKWLYNHNSQQQGHDPVNFHDIPFVKDFLSTHPGHHIPLFLLLSKEQAAVLIQAFWRGYKIRVRPDVQELRRWQREQREHRDARRTAAEFWRRQESRESVMMVNVPESSPRLMTPEVGEWDPHPTPVQREGKVHHTIELFPGCP